MSYSALEQMIRGGGVATNRNLDLTLRTDEDLSERQYMAVFIDTDGTAIASGSIFAGILQNKGEDGVAQIRYAGVSRIILGEWPGGSGSIDAGQKLILHPTDGVALPWTAVGSTKESVLVKVINPLTGAAVTGLTNDFVVRLFYRSAAGPIVNFDMDFAFVEEVDSVSSAGWYEIGIEDGKVEELDAPHSMDITLPSNPEYIVTPSGYSWRPRPVLGERYYFATVTTILGESIEAGVTDDAVLCKLFPQIF